jgi:hypothetical protein
MWAERGRSGTMVKKKFFITYSSPNIITTTKSRRIRRAGQVARMRANRKTYNWYEELEVKSILGGPKHRWKNMKLDLKKLN